jgi:tRNA modification GTPase
VLADDTIAAISTPPGEGAIAIIRVSGPDARRIGAELLGRTTALADRVLHFGTFRHQGRKLDEGLIALFTAPRSYTGEDMAELQCHGGTLVTAQLYEAVLDAGARAADPGEFTHRAFLRGKMDLTQAEAVMDVIRASTPRALHAAQEQLGGRLGAAIQEIRTDILGTVAHLEAYIDFPEEGIDPHVGTQLLADIERGKCRIESLLATGHEGRILREGVRLVLCGAPNAGKSSLLNRMLGFERAIVSAIPGTTRDTIEEFASLHGLPFRITDTAGVRETTDEIEKEGVDRARQAIERADVIVHLVDARETWPEPFSDDEIFVLNKIDLLGDAPVSSGLGISCLTGDGIEKLVDAVVEKAQGQRLGESPMLAAINARHQNCLERARQALVLAHDELHAGAAPELVAVPLRDALDAVSEVVGATDIEEILGQIFSTFCIGK